uniref:Uncharacterized protein n=1 Tax=viral metagenome TaxID=1070528 RepID=A0A6M3L9K1_9ZZZZ
MWDGQERRSQQPYCRGHLEFSNTLVRIEERLIAVDRRINGTIDDVKHHIENSRPRNIALIGALLTIVIFLINFSYGLGQNQKQIAVNTIKLEKSK